MANRQLKKERGVFQRPKGSGIWWINYYENGKQHREKAGSRSAAIDLYKIRKAAILKGEKLPNLKRDKVTISALLDDLLEFVKDHRSESGYKCKAKIVREAIGTEFASSVTPQCLDRWLTVHCKTPATRNRYRSFLSLMYRQGIQNGKVEGNPARLVRQRPEGTGRFRYLSRDEYDRLIAVISEKYPEHLAAFILSVHTGMRLSEQFSLTWNQVHLERRNLELTKTKNGNARTVYLNSDAVAAIDSMKTPTQKGTDKVFICAAKNYEQRAWFKPALAEAKIKDYLWHSNRHTFCSWLAMAGATMKEIQEAAGHKNIIVSARYAHLSPSHQQSVVERISAKASS